MGIRLNGDLIREIRQREFRLTQDGLIGRSIELKNGISIRSLRNAEAGRPVGVDVFTRLAKVLGVTPADDLRAEKGLSFDQLRRAEGKAADAPPARPKRWTPAVLYPLQPAPHFAGREKLLDELVEWAAAPSPRVHVTALVAPGGTGKTALTEKVVAGLARHTAAGVLVWSFYSNPKTEAFLRAACEYVLGEAPKETGGLLQRLRQGLAGETPHLFVLDGLELIQASGRSGRILGEFQNAPQMKLFLRWLAAGQGTCAKALVTSRFPLPDLADWMGSGYREEALSDLDVVAARTVLRARGVRGDDAALDALAGSVHRHALTIDVLGSYLDTYCQGDPRKAPSFDPKDYTDADPKTAKLYRVLASYSKRLSPRERDLLVRLSAFSRGVTGDNLGFLVEAGGVVAGALIGCKRPDLLKLLERLRRLGLVFRFQGPRGERFTAHPFVRDFFSKVTPPTAAEIFEAVRNRLAPALETHMPSNNAIPNFVYRNDDPAAVAGQYLGTPNDLDRYEDYIEFTRLAGRTREAIDLYSSEFGCFDHLGHALGEHARGVRILSGFVPESQINRFATGLPDEQRILHLTNLGMHASVLGDLKTAEASFHHALAISRDTENYPRTAIILQNLCGTHLLFGNYVSVANYAAEAREVALSVVCDATGRYERVMGASCVYLAHAMAQMGRNKEARRYYKEVVRLECESLNAGRGLWESEFLHCTGAVQAAVAEAQHYRDQAAKQQWGRLMAFCDASLARYLCATNTRLANVCLHNARSFGGKSGEVNILLRCYHAAAEIARTEANYPLALGEAERGIQLADSYGFGRWAIDLRIELARIHLAAKQPGEAVPPAATALERAERPDCQYKWAISDSLHLLGVAHATLGSTAPAKGLLQRALAMRESLEHPAVAQTRKELRLLLNRR